MYDDEIPKVSFWKTPTMKWCSAQPRCLSGRLGNVGASLLKLMDVDITSASTLLRESGVCRQTHKRWEVSEVIGSLASIWPRGHHNHVTHYKYHPHNTAPTLLGSYATEKGLFFGLNFDFEIKAALLCSALLQNRTESDRQQKAKIFSLVFSNNIKCLHPDSKPPWTQKHQPFSLLLVSFITNNIRKNALLSGNQQK